MFKNFCRQFKPSRLSIATNNFNNATDKTHSQMSKLNTCPTIMEESIYKSYNTISHNPFVQVILAPRGSGKTTSALSAANRLKNDGRFSGVTLLNFSKNESCGPYISNIILHKFGTNQQVVNGGIIELIKQYRSPTFKNKSTHLLILDDVDNISKRRGFKSLMTMFASISVYQPINVLVLCSQMETAEKIVSCNKGYKLKAIVDDVKTMKWSMKECDALISKNENKLFKLDDSKRMKLLKQSVRVGTPKFINDYFIDEKLLHNDDIVEFEKSWKILEPFNTFDKYNAQ